MIYNAFMKKIGLLIERHWHYGRRLCEGIASRSRELGEISLEFLDWEDVEAAKRLGRFDGFVVRVWSRAIARRFAATRRPVVDVFGGVPDTGFATVDQDAAGIGRLASAHFVDRRFTHFAFCGYKHQRYSILRRMAFVETLKEFGFDCDVFEDPTFTAEKFGRTVLGKGIYNAGLRAKPLEVWLKRLAKPVAVLCAHDLVALQVVQSCKKSGLLVPDEVAVLGVDDDPLLCDFLSPTISSIDPNPFEIGRKALETVASWIDYPPEKPCDIHPAPVGLVERDSTLAFPAPAFWLSSALAYIRRNIGRNINATEVISALGLSHTTVETAFRKGLGTTLRKEIARVRIEEAKRLLGNPAVSLAEVCKRSGFSSSAYFTATFRKATGKTPLVWRNEKRSRS